MSRLAGSHRGSDNGRRLGAPVAASAARDAPGVKEASRIVASAC